MNLKKKKTIVQIVLMGSILNRLRGVPEDLMSSGEPMLSARVSALIADLQISLENSEEMTNGN